MAAMSAEPEFATLTADDTVTGEAVALDLPAAGLASRMLSGLLDVTVTVVVLLVAFVLVSVATVNASGAVVWIGVIGTMITVFLVLPTALESALGGRSLGKLAAGLRTVRDDAGPITVQHAFVRHLVGFVEVYAFFGGPAFFSAMLSARGKRLGDFAAGTYVVRERVRRPVAHPPAMPPPLAHWARTADVASLPTGLALAVRRLLSRSHEVTPESTARIAHDLAAQVRRHVAPPPPPGTPDLDLLAAVVATRRERDHARLGREEALRQRLTTRR